MANLESPVDERSDEISPAFLTSLPPAWLARAIAMFLLALFAVVIVAAAIIDVPETVVSPFVLVPVQGTDPVRAPRDGIVAVVKVAEGQAVAADAPIFVIRSPRAGERSAELRGLEIQLTGTAERHANEFRRYDSQRLAEDEEDRRLRGQLAYVARKIEEQRTMQTIRQGRYQASLAIVANDNEIVKREIEFKRAQFAVARQLAERSGTLHKDGIISWVEHTTRQLEAARLESDLQQLARQLESGALKINQLKADEAQQEVEWRLATEQVITEHRGVQRGIDKLRHESAGHLTVFKELERSLGEERDRTSVRTTALRKELDGTNGSDVTITAPCAGTVLRLRVQAAGAMVHEGDVLGELACAGGRLQGELTVPSAGVGLIKAQQAVKLLYDTFPYQRYGIRHGTVRWVSPASVMVRESALFRILVDVQDEMIRVDGEPRPLTAGMSGTAKIVVGRRSLLTYAFEPLRQLRENFADAPPRAAAAEGRR